MSKIIKIRCNGPGKHVNEFDENEFKKILNKRIVIYKGIKEGGNHIDQQSIPGRIVTRCKDCGDGKVIITREAILHFLQNKN